LSAEIQYKIAISDSIALREMRFLANENFPGDAVAALKAAGHDIVWVRTAAPGSKDKDILAWAEREARVLLTFDKDFGELAWHVGLPASSGVVLFRLPTPIPAEVGAISVPAWRHHHARPFFRTAV
jgi:predicted nuclease of predicted toxin-antitoxin system